MIVKPLNKNVLVAQVEREAATASGIILQGASGDGNTASGKILAVGPDATQVKVGDEVYLTWSKGKQVTVNGAQRIMISEDDIVAVLEK